jgi:chaperone required for assembly of F1-ATPase
MASPKGEIDRRPRRFYEKAGVVASEGRWAVQLDGKPLRTPAKKLLALPTEALANAVADEWARQGERIDLASMHNLRIANVAIDRAPETRSELAAEAARYAGTDLTCHLADAPQELKRRQEAAWAPLRAWAAEAHGVKLETTTGVLPREQPTASVEAVLRHAASLDDFRLTALVHAIALFGSAVLGLAVERGRITAVEAHRLARIDEEFQAGLWGEDAEATSRAAFTREEARALDVWFAALG